jgi:pimeloyl-ACP methyl ester carboxylesterase
MSILDFLCDIRFHRSYFLPPNPDTGRATPYRVSYADYGDPESNAVVLFCGALMGTRFCYSPLDQLAKAHNVRIIHPDRPGIGGSHPVELEKRIQIWLGLWIRTCIVWLCHVNLDRNGTVIARTTEHRSHIPRKSQWRRYLSTKHHAHLSTPLASGDSLCLLLRPMGCTYAMMHKTMFPSPLSIYF